MIDSSGSIMNSDYKLQLNFIAEVVTALPVAADKVRVASVVFGTLARVTFHFDNFTDTKDIVDEIKNTIKDNGGTNTPTALSLTRTEVFDPANGARPSARKVAVLLTDVESYDFDKTVAEARKLRRDGVTVFAIGVGRYNLTELLSVASSPVCTHVYVLDNYAHIDSILYEIQKNTCEAPKVVTANQTVTGHIPFNGTMVTIGTTRPMDNDTVLAVRSNCSILDVYVSYTNPKPNAAIYAEKFTATDGKPAFLTMEGTDHGMPVYVTIVGTRLPNSTAQLANCSDFLYEVKFEKNTPPKVVTANQTVTGHIPFNGTMVTIGTTRPMDNDTVLAVRSNCSILDVYVSYTNPKPNAAIYAEKFTATDGKPAFLTMEGTDHGMPVYVTIVGTRLPNSTAQLANCSDFLYEVKFEKNTPVEIVCREKSTYRDCHPEDFIGSPFQHLLCDDQKLPANPCTPAAISSCQLIHPHPYNSDWFIKCDLRGQMYITLCPNGQPFNKVTLSCGFDNLIISGGIPLPDNYNNPCTPALVASGVYFFPYANDRHSYIQCDVWGGAVVKSCANNDIWNDQAHTCIPDSLHLYDSTTVAPFQVVNPCTPQTLAAGLLFFPYPCEHNKYIHCDISGNYYIQSCPASMFFDPSTFICSPVDSQVKDPACGAHIGRK